MKLVCMAALAFLSLPALAQDKPEKVEVTGSRIPSTVFGPIVAAGGPVGDAGKGCAEPNCGLSPEDPSGSGAPTQQQKDAGNKRAKDKAKQPKNQGKLADSMKRDQGMIDKLFSWMSGGVSVDWGGWGFLRITTPNATIEGEGCVQNHTKIAQTNPQEAKDFCVERRADTETVKKLNGQIENQLNLTYKIYDTCYWEKTCGVETITFVAGSVGELRVFLNEVIGERYY
jgi:hypothetical protein